MNLSRGRNHRQQLQPRLITATLVVGSAAALCLGCAGDAGAGSAAQAGSAGYG
jgi:hypothetical protein